MDRLTIDQVLKPGEKIDVKLIDLSDPSIIKLFEETKKRQEEVLRQRDQPFENLTITI
jgi:hypothetical protein